MIKIQILLILFDKNDFIKLSVSTNFNIQILNNSIKSVRKIGENSMMRESEKRIQQLELSINILEEHLKKYGSQIDSKAYNYIQNQINIPKRELKIWKDFPIQEI